MSNRLTGGTGSLEEALARIDVDMVGVASLTEKDDQRLVGAAKRLLPSARSVVVVANEVYSEVLAHSTPVKTMGEGALRDILAPHFDFLDGRLCAAVYAVARAARLGGFQALPLPAGGCPIDARYLHSAFSFKHAAQAAGLGIIGKSGLLITPRFGPRVRLAGLLTSAELKGGSVRRDDPCSGCQVCLASCPSRALAEPTDGEAYSMNKFACGAFRNASGACSECMRVCPAGE